MIHSIKKIAIITFTFFLLSIPTVSMAQDPEPWDEVDENLDTPIDGGLSILAAAGVAYGVRKRRERKKL